jgi:hypothetical protein
MVNILVHFATVNKQATNQTFSTVITGQASLARENHLTASGLVESKTRSVTRNGALVHQLAEVMA